MIFLKLRSVKKRTISRNRVDDIIIIHEHSSRLKEVLKRFRKANLKIQPDKCEFRRREVAYLDYIITKNREKPNRSIVEAVKNFAEPKYQKDVKRCFFFPLSQTVKKHSKFGKNN